MRVSRWTQMGTGQRGSVPPRVKKQSLSELLSENAKDFTERLGQRVFKANPSAETLTIPLRSSEGLCPVTVAWVNLSGRASQSAPRLEMDSTPSGHLRFRHPIRDRSPHMAIPSQIERGQSRSGMILVTGK